MSQQASFESTGIFIGNSSRDFCIGPPAYFTPFAHTSSALAVAPKGGKLARPGLSEGADIFRQNLAATGLAFAHQSLDDLTHRRSTAAGGKHCQTCPLPPYFEKIFKESPLTKCASFPIIVE